MPVRVVAICVYYVSVWLCTLCNDSIILNWPIEAQWTVSVMPYVFKCLFSGAILPFISPLTKYTAMLNAAVPYNYPGKHWRSLCHSRFECNWKLTFQHPKTPTLFFSSQFPCEMMETCPTFQLIHVNQKEETWIGSKIYNFRFSHVNICLNSCLQCLCPTIKILFNSTFVSSVLFQCI